MPPHLENHVSQHQPYTLTKKVGGVDIMKIPVSSSPGVFGISTPYTLDTLSPLLNAANYKLSTKRIVRIIDTLHDFWNLTKRIGEADIKQALNGILSKYLSEFKWLSVEEKHIYNSLLTHSGAPGLLLALTRVNGAPPALAFNPNDHARVFDHSGMGSVGAQPGITTNAISTLEPHAVERYLELDDKERTPLSLRMNIDLDLEKLYDMWKDGGDRTTLIKLLENQEVDVIRINFPKDRGTRRAFFSDKPKCSKVGEFILLFYNYGLPVSQLRMFIDATAGKLPKFFDGFEQVKICVAPESIGDSAVNAGMNDKSKRKEDDDEDDDDALSSGIKKEYVFLDNEASGLQRISLSKDNLFTTSADRTGVGSFKIWYSEIPDRVFSRNDPACIRLNVEYTPDAVGGATKLFTEDFTVMSTGTPVSGPSVATLSAIMDIIHNNKLDKAKIIAELKKMDVRRQLDLTKMVIDMIKHGIDLDLILAFLADIKRLGDYNQNRVAKLYEDLMKILVLATSGDILSNYNAKEYGLNSAIPRGHAIEMTRFPKSFMRDPAVVAQQQQVSAESKFTLIKSRMEANIETHKGKLNAINTSKTTLENIYKGLTEHYISFPLDQTGNLTELLYDIARANRIETIRNTQLDLMKLLLNIDDIRKNFMVQGSTFEDSLNLWCTIPAMTQAEGVQIEVARNQWIDLATRKIETMSQYITKNDDLQNGSSVIRSLLETPLIKVPNKANGNPQSTVLDPYSKLVFDLSNYVDLDIIMSDPPKVLNHTDINGQLLSLINFIVNSRYKVLNGVYSRNNGAIELARVKLIEFQIGLRDLLLNFTQAYSLNDNPELKLRLDDILKDIASLENISYDKLLKEGEGEYSNGYGDDIHNLIGNPMDEEPNYNMRCRVVRYVCKQIESIRGIRVKIQNLYSGSMVSDVPNPLPLAIELSTCRVVQGCIPFIPVGANGGGNMETIVGGELTSDQKEGINRMLMEMSLRAQQAMEVAYAVMYPYRIKRRRYNEIMATVLIDSVTIESWTNETILIVEQSAIGYSTNYDEIHDKLFEIENQLKIPQLPSISGRMENNDAKRAELNGNILDRIRAIKTALDALDREITLEEVSLQQDQAIEFITGDHARRGSSKSLRPNPADFISRENPVIPAFLLDQFEAAKPATFRDGLLTAYTELIVDLLNETNSLELASTDMTDELKLIFYIVHKINPDLTAIIRTSDYNPVEEPTEFDTFETNMDRNMNDIIDSMDPNNDSIVASISLLDDYDKKQISVIYMLSLLNSNNQYAYFKDMYKPSMPNGDTVSISDKIIAFYTPRNLIKGYDRLVQLQQEIIRRRTR